MKLIDRIRSRRLKGAVLFTVVSVCAVIIIFVMATLTVVATVQKRTYSDYAKSQSYYTARSAVNSVITALNESDDLALTFKNISGRTDLKINMSTSNDMGQITSCYVDKITDEMYKICATARVLDDESTVAVYVYEGTRIEPSSGKSSSSAITTFGSANSNNLSMIGGSAINVYAKTCPSGEYLQNSNNSGIVGDLIVNGSYHFTAQTKMVFERGQGASIFGDLTNQNGTIAVSVFNIVENGSDYCNGYPLEVIGDGETVKISDIPYIFCTGKFAHLNNSTSGIGLKGDNAYCPINVYCGYAVIGGNCSSANGSIYCYDATKKSVREEKNQFSLYGWIESLTQNGATSQNVIHKGNFYTKGDFEIVPSGSSTFRFEGDLCVDGTLTISAGNPTNVYIGGNFKVGKLNVSSNVKFFDLNNNPITPYVTSTDDKLGLSDYYSVLGVSDFDAMRNKLTANPALKQNFGGTQMSYQEVLDTFTFFPSDYELRNMLCGYYYALDISGNVDKSVIYHDDVKTGTEPEKYEYQKPESGFINTVASVKEQFPVDDVKSVTDADGNVTTEIYECETYSSVEEFDKVLKGSGNYLDVTFNGSNCTVKIRDFTDQDITDTIADTSKYYSVDNGTYTFYTNAIFRGQCGMTTYIDPQTAKQDIYIRFEDFSFPASNHFIVVKDEKLKSSIDGSEVLADQYVCYMYASTAKTVSQKLDSNNIYENNCITLDSGAIVSEYYYKYLKNGNDIYLEQYPSEENYRQMPNIYMYVQPYTNIKMINNCSITAYITAPRSSLSIDNAKTASGKMYYTTGKFTDTISSPPKADAYSQRIDIKSDGQPKGLALLGSFVFGSASMNNSTVSYIYISDEGRGDNDADDNGKEVYTWQPLYYDSN